MSIVSHVKKINEYAEKHEVRIAVANPEKLSLQDVAQLYEFLATFAGLLIPVCLLIRPLLGRKAKAAIDKVVILLRRFEPGLVRALPRR